MKIWRDKADPLVSIAIQHKRRMKMKAESIDVVLTTPFSTPIVSTLKIDGEHTIIVFNRAKNAQDCVLANSYGTMREDTPPGKELAQIAAKTPYNEIVCAGELYAIYEDGHRMQLNEVIHHLKAPKDAKEEARIKIALFDILTLDGKPVEGNYWERIVFLNHLLGADTTAVHCVPAKQGSPEIAKEMWENDVIGRKMEGLVIHSNGVVKVKVISNMDVVVVGMKKEGERFPRGEVGSLLTAFMAPDGTFIVSSNVNVANHHEQKEWFNWIMANHAGEMVVDGTPYVMCKPQRIVEVAANDWYIHEQADLPGYIWDGTKYTYSGLFPGAKGQKPRFAKDEQGNIRERKDKGVNPTDLRLTQVPDFNEEWLVKPSTVASTPAAVAATPAAGTIEDEWKAYAKILFAKGNPARGDELTLAGAADWWDEMTPEERRSMVTLAKKFGGLEGQPISFTSFFSGLPEKCQNWIRRAWITPLWKAYELAAKKPNPANSLEITVDHLKKLNRLKNFLDELEFKDPDTIEKVNGDIEPLLPAMINLKGYIKEVVRFYTYVPYVRLKEGNKITIPPDLTTDPSNRGGQTGVISGITGDITDRTVYVTFADGKTDLFDADIWETMGQAALPDAIDILVLDNSGSLAFTDAGYNYIKDKFNDLVSVLVTIWLENAKVVGDSFEATIGIRLRDVSDISENPLSAVPITGEPSILHSTRQKLRMGILAEVDAINLYEQMAADAPLDVKTLLLDIAKEEKTHIGEFEAMLEKWDKEHAKEMKAGAKEAAAISAETEKQVIKGIQVNPAEVG